MPASRQTLIDQIESYYAAVDSLDTAAIVSHFTPDAVMEIPTGDVRHGGHDAIKATYDRRASEVEESYHGKFIHVIDAEEGRASTRLATRRTTTEGQTIEMDCIAFFKFEDTLIKRIAIWMSGENSLK